MRFWLGETIWRSDTKVYATGCDIMVPCALIITWDRAILDCRGYVVGWMYFCGIIVAETVIWRARRIESGQIPVIKVGHKLRTRWCTFSRSISNHCVSWKYRPLVYMSSGRYQFGEGVWGKMWHHHCGITEFEIDSVGNVRLSSMNQTGHLPQRLITESFWSKQRGYGAKLNVCTH